MTTKCVQHPSNVVNQFCETCNRPICKDCVRHDDHIKIALREIQAAIAALDSKYATINDDVRCVEQKVAENTNAVVRAVEEAGKAMKAEVSDIRKKEVELSKEITAIWNNKCDPVEVKYQRIKKLEKEQSKYSTSQRLVCIPFHYYSDTIAKAIGRLSWVDADQEIVEHCSFMTPSSTFIRSIRPVDTEKAWILHYQDQAIHLMDFNGRILDTRNFGEQIDDFCLQTNGDVLYTAYNESDLKRFTKDKKTISLYTFDSHYTTRGICLRGEDVMVCLCSTDKRMANRVAKMSVDENTARELEMSTQIELFQPGRVSSLPGGNIAVVDWRETGKGRFLSVIDGRGNLSLTWSGEMKGRPAVSPFEPYDVSFCNINDEKRLLVTLGGPTNRVCSLSVDSKEAKCIYTGDKDSCNGGIATDAGGNIWIGDSKGRVHIMKCIQRNEMG